jgi:hypothetical protein
MQAQRLRATGAFVISYLGSDKTDGKGEKIARRIADGDVPCEGSSRRERAHSHGSHFVVRIPVYMAVLSGAIETDDGSSALDKSPRGLYRLVG